VSLYCPTRRSSDLGLPTAVPFGRPIGAPASSGQVPSPQAPHRSSHCRPRPERDGHCRPLPRLGVQLERVGQAPRSSESETETTGTAVTVGQGLLHVRDAGSVIPEHQLQCRVVRRTLQSDRGHTATAVLQCVPGKLTRRCHHLGLIDQGETHGDGHLPSGLPDMHDVHLLLDGQFLHCRNTRHRGPVPSSRESPSSTFSAVSRSGKGKPSSTRAKATSGRIPTTTVRAANNAHTSASSCNVLARNESTSSRPETSMRTPRAPVPDTRLARSSRNVNASRSLNSPWKVTRKTSLSLMIEAEVIASPDFARVDHLEPELAQRVCESVGERGPRHDLAEADPQLHHRLGDLRPDTADDAFGTHQP